MKKKVLFITQVCFLDAALEYIEEVKNYVDLSVIIQIDPNSKDKNIVNIKNLPKKNTFVNAEQLLDKSDLIKFKPYIVGCKSFDFMVYQQIKSFSISSVIKSFLLFKKVKKLMPNFIHFDDVTTRLIIFPFFSNFVKSKLIMNVHDPIQHSGEKNKKNLFARKIFYRKVYKFITFSIYSKVVFEKIYGKKNYCVNLNLKPYKYYNNYFNNNTNNNSSKYISFIGRVSEYKGIDVFLDAISILNVKYPETQYLIAGSPNNNYLGEFLKNKYSFTNVKFILKHLTNSEICNFIKESKAIVCPYRDATQSGVIMTSLALFTPIIVSRQGGLPEYVQNNITGIIVDSEPESFAKAIETFILDESKSNKLSQNIKNLGIEEFNLGIDKILKLYS